MTRVRIKSERTPYRRAGLKFGSRDWVVVEDPRELSEEQQLRLLADPVLSLEIETQDNGWRRLDPADRAEAVKELERRLQPGAWSQGVVPPSPTEPPAPAGGSAEPSAKPVATAPEKPKAKSPGRARGGSARSGAA